MKRNHFLICSCLFGLGNDILSYFGGFNIAASNDDGKFDVEHQQFSSGSKPENSLKNSFSDVNKRYLAIVAFTHFISISISCLLLIFSIAVVILDSVNRYS